MKIIENAGSSYAQLDLADPPAPARLNGCARHNHEPLYLAWLPQLAESHVLSGANGRWSIHIRQAPFT